MAGERSRRSSRPRKGFKDDDSDDADIDMGISRVDNSGSDHNRESDRLAKIQEKNRKAQQKFRERRKEKMQSMEQTIASLEQSLLQVRTEKEHIQEQLAVEKRVNAENAAKRERGISSLGVEGLQDYDPIDMSFLPMWHGLHLSNEKIRSMPMDTLKMLIQTILQDLRARLTKMASEGAGSAASLGPTVSAAFAFLNRCYLVEPIRYRKVVCEMMGPGASSTGGSSSSQDSKSTAPLSREQEMAIGKEVEAFDKAVAALWNVRDSICDTLRSCRGTRGSELENMRSFLQVHEHLETLQDTLRSENETLVTFLTNVGRILGHMQLTQAMFATGGQDIFTYCQSIHCRALMLNSTGAVQSTQLQAQQSGGTGHFGQQLSASGPLLQGSVPSTSWFNTGSGRGDAPGSCNIMGAGSIPLQDNYMIRALGESTAIDLELAQQRQRSTVSADGRSLDAAASTAQQNPQQSVADPSSATHHKTIMHDSPFLYGPGQAGGQAAPSFKSPRGRTPSASTQTNTDFRAAKVPKTEPETEVGVSAIAGPSNRQDSFLELFRSIGDVRKSDPLRLSAGLRTLLRDAQMPSTASLGLPADGPLMTLAGGSPGQQSGQQPGQQPGQPSGQPSGQQVTAAPPAGDTAPQGRWPLSAELLGSISTKDLSSPAVQGLVSILASTQQQQSARRSDSPPTSCAPPNIISDLENLLNSKEGSRTLETLAQELTTSRTLSAGELIGLTNADGSAAGVHLAKSDVVQAPLPPATTGPIISGITATQRQSVAGTPQVTSGGQHK